MTKTLNKAALLRWLKHHGACAEATAWVRRSRLTPEGMWKRLCRARAINVFIRTETEDRYVGWFLWLWFRCECPDAYDKTATAIVRWDEQRRKRRGRK